jgi:uncharacterized membrane protein YkvA (DUF1232 family)
MFEGWRDRVGALKREVTAIGIAARDPRTGWAARIIVLAIVAYALSPIDLIPDFIPVLGYLDELLLLPAALMLAVRLIPPDVMAQARDRASGVTFAANKAAATTIVLIWIALAAGGLWATNRLFNP